MSSDMRNDVQIDPLAKFDANYISDTMYTEDINKKMRVPKRIRVGSPNEDDLSSNSVTSLGGYWPKNMENNYNDERLDMKVPERIIVTGSGQHLGTKTLPREIMLEDQVMPRDPGVMRVATPPRVLTLDKYHYPSVKDPPLEPESNVPIVKPRSRFNMERSFQPNDGVLVPTKRTASKNPSTTALATLTNRSQHSPERSFTDVDVFAVLNSTSGVIGAGDGLTPAEEVLHLRKQVAKLNRRVMAIELDNMQRQQKEKIVYGLGLAYFIFKALLWLNRS